mmetsp:Transcript_78405/g.227577  ORF Transcript_78405/g.227577 Transcript_78405/m.227577 type:complete len:160 (-) Transcript_78405:255-734(-)
MQGFLNEVLANVCCGKFFKPADGALKVEDRVHYREELLEDGSGVRKSFQRVASNVTTLRVSPAVVDGAAPIKDFGVASAQATKPGMSVDDRGPQDLGGDDFGLGKPKFRVMGAAAVLATMKPHGKAADAAADKHSVDEEVAAQPQEGDAHQGDGHAEST